MLERVTLPRTRATTMIEGLPGQRRFAFRHPVIWLIISPMFEHCSQRPYTAGG